jgi:hypothetical protein
MLMSQQVSHRSDDVRFSELMRKGQLALSEGKRGKAHQCWRRAAMLRPYEEQVWLALLSVLDQPEDRRVCLENIVSINPKNLQARQQLDEFIEKTQPATPVYDVPTPTLRDALGVVWMVAESVLLGLILAVALSIFLYGV